MFDTLKAYNALKDAGEADTLAKAHVDVLQGALSRDTFATKDDLKAFEEGLTIRIGAMLAVSIGALWTLDRLFS